MKRLVAIILTVLMAAILAPSALAAEVQTHEYNSNSFAIRAEAFFVIAPDGKLVAWGGNDTGLLGTYDVPDLSFEDRRVVMENVKAVYASNWCIFALDNDGVLYGWGANMWGLLCGLEPEEGDFKVKLMADVVSVAVGSKHCAAVKKDGSLWVWGMNDSGQLGRGYRDDEVYLPQKVLDGVASVYVLGPQTFAIDDSGNLYAWGGNAAEGYSDMFTPSLVAANIKALAPMMDYYYQLLGTDGTLRMLHCGEEFQVYGSFDNPDVPFAENVQNLLDYGHIREDGSLWLWENSGEFGSFVKFTTGISAAQYSQFSTYLLTLSTDGTLRLSNIRVGGTQSCKIEKLTTNDSGNIKVVLLAIGIVCVLFLLGLAIWKYFEKEKRGHA